MNWFETKHYDLAFFNDYVPSTAEAQKAALVASANVGNVNPQLADLN